VAVSISVTGEYITPFVISLQGNKAMEMRPKQHGFSRGINLILKRRSNPALNTELFGEYIAIVLLQYIKELQTSEQFAWRDAVILMDNYSIHTRGDKCQRLAGHGVNMTTIPLHTTDVFQSLDLSLFDVFKNKT
jgi:hypothetical protein